MLTLNQTREERAEGEMRIYGAKVRDDASQWIERVRIDPARYTVSSIDRHAEPEESLEDHPANEPAEPPPPHSAEEPPPPHSKRRAG